jgi:Fe-S oxidoreductase
MQLPIETAKEEIIKLIETRSVQKILKNCAGCSYCNVVCPTGSNPAQLIREIRLRHNSERGIRCTGLITEEIPHNLMSIGLSIDTADKKPDLLRYENPPESDQMFYMGCAIPYLFPDIAKTKLFEKLPILGGMKYCCGGYVRTFGDNETKIKGNELFQKFKELEIKKLITFCPGCDSMIKGVYPSLVDGFNIEGQTIIDYFVEKYHKGEFTIKNKISKRITFQDPCPWRSLDRKIYEGPREFLEIMGAEVVEMKHNKESSLCCGSPLLMGNPSLAAETAEKRMEEAKLVEAEVIAHICTGCYSALSNPASKRDIRSYYITELAQLAIGERPSQKILENTKKLQKQVFQTISQNPQILSERYIIKDGKINRLR